MVLGSVEFFCANSSTLKLTSAGRFEKENTRMKNYLEVDNMIVPVVTNLDILEAQLGQDPLPGVTVDEGGRVHDATVRDDQNVLLALLGHGEVGVLQCHHGTHKMFLKIQYLDIFIFKFHEFPC